MEFPKEVYVVFGDEIGVFSSLHPFDHQEDAEGFAAESHYDGGYYAVYRLYSVRRVSVHRTTEEVVDESGKGDKNAQ